MACSGGLWQRGRTIAPDSFGLGDLLSILDARVYLLAWARLLLGVGASAFWCGRVYFSALGSVRAAGPLLVDIFELAPPTLILGMGASTLGIGRVYFWHQSKEERATTSGAGERSLK